jgi:hypothetical protein
MRLLNSWFTQQNLRSATKRGWICLARIRPCRFKRLSDGTVIAEDFLRLRYPCYWHYDILWGLKVMAEVGVLADTRCDEALEVLTSKRLVDGGFPAEKKHYQVTNPLLSGYSLVDWGGTSLKRMNPFVTVEALSLLKRSSAGGSFSSSAQAKS